MSDPVEHRLHVVAAVDEGLKGLRDLAVPLLIGVVVGGSRSSASAVLFGLLAAVAALVLGVARWRATSYAVTDRALHFRSGVFSPDETVVPLDRIQAVDTIAGPVQRLFGVTGLHVQTPGGGEDGDIVLSALSSRAAADLRTALRHPDHGLGGPRRRLSLRGLLATALTAPQLGVLLPVVGAAFGALQNGMLGAGEAAIKDVNSTNEVVLVALALLLAAWLLSFLGAVVAFGGFEVQRVEGRLRIRRGLLQRRAVSVPVARVDGVQVVEGLLRRPFGLVTLRLEATSLGKREAAARTLFPLMRRAEVEPFLRAQLPELAGSLTVDERPPPRARRRYLTWRLAVAAAVAAVALAGPAAAWPGIAVVAIVAVWSGLDAYAATGLRLADGDARVIVRARRFGARVTLVARRRRLQELEVTRSPLQRRAGLATVRIAVARGTWISVRHVERAQAAGALAALTAATTPPPPGLSRSPRAVAPGAPRPR